jgi:hypothetical protein
VQNLNIELHAGYTDGHVENCIAGDTIGIQVIKDRSDNEPYEYGPGIFYLPKQGLK